jgi:fructuronate reductase
MTRLDEKMLRQLPALVRTPRYERTALPTGIVHLGIGAFHRAHQAVYTEAAIEAGDRDWGIVGVSLRSTDTRDALQPQDCLYTVGVRSGEGDKFQIVGAIRDILVAPENPQAVLDRLCAASVRIVSLTVTEKGYCHDPATGDLAGNHPDIVHDLADRESPRSVPGFLVEALARRRAIGLAPFTVVCCDNLPANGKTVHRIVTQFAACRDRDLARYIEDNVAFPSTMVDRIVPATTDEDRARVAAALGASDAWPVMTEPFSQWVIEETFPRGRPDWALSGAQFVADVEPYETMKLRLLNGSHSALAYLGYLAGHETVSAAMADPVMSAFIAELMDEEISPTLHVPADADLAGYKRALRERFRNPALKHRTWQIAMDGTQKLPQRLLGTIRHRLAAGAAFERLALVIAAWMLYVRGIGLDGRPIDVRDPLAVELRRRADAAGQDPAALVSALLALPAVFGSDLAENSRFRERVTAQVGSLLRDGVTATLRQTIAAA